MYRVLGWIFFMIGLRGWSGEMGFKKEEREGGEWGKEGEIRAAQREKYLWGVDYYLPIYQLITTTSPPSIWYVSIQSNPIFQFTITVH